MRVLLVNAGRRVELVRLVKEHATVIACDMDPLAPALYHADIAERVPAVGSGRVPIERCSSGERLVNSVVKLCRSHVVDVVLPTTDRELALLSATRAFFEPTRVIVSPPEGVAAAQDKLGYAEALAGTGIKVVPTRSFVKPRYWSGEPGQQIVQPFINAPEVTVDALAVEGRAPVGGRIAAIGARERLKVRGGEVERARTIDAYPFMQMAIMIADALPLKGPFNFQVFLTDEGPLLSDINARVGGGLPLSEAAGAGIIPHLLGSPHPTCVAKPGVYMSRHDTSMFLREEELAWSFPSSAPRSPDASES